jgi:hypothetical protein
MDERYQTIDPMVSAIDTSPEKWLGIIFSIFFFLNILVEIITFFLWRLGYLG